MASPLVTPQDPLTVVGPLLDDLLVRLPQYEGFEWGDDVPDQTTPTRFIRVDEVGRMDLDRALVTEHEVRFQVWFDGTPQQRVSLANQLLAQLRAKLRARRQSGPITITDPANDLVSLSQFVVSIPLRGIQK